MPTHLNIQSDKINKLVFICERVSTAWHGIADKGLETLHDSMSVQILMDLKAQADEAHNFAVMLAQADVLILQMNDDEPVVGPDMGTVQ